MSPKFEIDVDLGRPILGPDPVESVMIVVKELTHIDGGSVRPITNRTAIYARTKDIYPEERDRTMRAIRQLRGVKKVTAFLPPSSDNKP